MFSATGNHKRANRLVRLLLACMSFVLVDVAAAADPVRGAALFAMPARPGLLPCADCHSDNPIVNNFGNIWSGRNASALIERAVQTNTGGMGIFQGVYGPAEFADIAAYLGNAPNHLAFPPTTIGAVSSPRTINISSSLKTGIDALRLSTEGDFVLVDTTCGSAVPRLSGCTVELAFRPFLPGERTGVLIISHAATPTPIRIPLGGEAVLPPAVADVVPSRVDFGEAGLMRQVEFRNQSATPIRLISIETASSDFPLVGGTCVAGLTLAAGQHCTVSLGPPRRDGSMRQGVLRIVHDGLGGGSTVELAAAGIATMRPSLSADASELEFAASTGAAAHPPQLVNVINPGPAAVTLREVAVDNAAFSVEGSTCAGGMRLAPGQLCQLSASYRPRRQGPVSAELRIATEDLAPPLRIGLSAAEAVLPTVAPARVRLRAPVGGQARATAFVVNSTSEPWRVRSVALVGPDAADFRMQQGGCAAGLTLAPGAHCAADITFTPRAEGDRLARVRLDFEVGSVAVELAGTATGAASAEVWLDSASLDFGSQPLGETSTPRTLAVHNRGQAPLTWERVALTGDDAGAFALADGCQEGQALAAGEGCEVRIRFAPRREREYRATLVFWHRGGTAAAVTLRGRGIGAATALLATDRLSIDFGKAPPSTPGAVRRVSLRNLGTAPAPAPSLATDNPVFSARFADHVCANQLPPAEACDIEVSFRPGQEGKHTGALRIKGPGLPTLVVALAAEGAAMAPALAWQRPPARPQPGTFVGTVDYQAPWVLVNRGNAPSSPMRWLIDGPASGDFSFAAGTTCASGRMLESGGSCAVQLAFHPHGAGERAARLVLLSDSLDPLALIGNGLAAASPDLQARPAAVTFEARTGTPPSPQRLLLRNVGAAAARIAALDFAGAAFTFATSRADACGGELPVLMPAEECELTLFWDGTAAGALGGRLSAAVAAEGFGAVVALQVREDPGQRTNVGGGGALPWLVVWAMAAGLAARRLARSQWLHHGSHPHRG